jgi:poly(3-hydroxybutyrate) depolymerase
MLIQGEDDEVVRPINQDQLQRQAMLLNRLHPGSPVEVALKPGGRRVLAHRIHDVRSGRQIMLRVTRISQLKHAWSGGDERVAYHSGPGPDASKMLLEFFARHSRKG